MNFKKVAISVGAAAMALSPAAAFAGNDSARLSAEVNIPHACSIDGDYHMVLVPNSPSQNNIRRSDQDAITISQNGSTLWSITDVNVVSQPVDSVLNGATGLGVDFRNTGSAPNGMSTLPDALISTLNGNQQRELTVRGALSGGVSVIANIDEDAVTYNPLTQSNQAAPLLGGEKYEIRARLRCTALQYNER